MDGDKLGIKKAAIELHVAAGIGWMFSVEAEGGVDDDVPVEAAEQPASINKDASTTSADRNRIRTFGEITVRPNESRA